ncbi:MAG: hypothetical protein JWN67_1645 [Actinomycetia bacterium]|nr:hypothetical protein [Actinomycetes bacterium]
MDPEPPLYDDALSLVLHGGSTAFLLGNPHTFPGRFNVYIPDQHLVLTCSLSDVESSSVLAGAWLRGFLAGNEPSPYEYFGDAADELADHGPEMTAWRALCDEFRRTGTAAPYLWCEGCGAPQLAELARPTCFRCGVEVDRDDDVAD